MNWEGFNIWIWLLGELPFLMPMPQTSAGTSTFKSFLQHAPGISLLVITIYGHSLAKVDVFSFWEILLRPTRLKSSCRHSWNPGHQSAAGQLCLLGLCLPMQGTSKSHWLPRELLLTCSWPDTYLFFHFYSGIFLSKCFPCEITSFYFYNYFIFNAAPHSRCR